MQNDIAVTLAQYLDINEKQALQAKLNQSGIIFVSNEHGPNTGNRQNFYYEIKVSSSQYNQAKKVLQEFKASQSLKNQRCPKCNSLSPEPLKKLTFFQRIIYIGTIPVRCKKCNTIYFI